jgi:hypothetical protein
MKPTGAQAHTCVVCKGGGYSISGSVNGCECAPGYESSLYECFLCPLGKFKADHGTARCTTCSAGKYASELGMTSCTICGAGTYSGTMGATVASTCILCPEGSNSTAGSTACPCSAGYTGPNNGCLKCATHTFKSSIGSAACTACTGNLAAPPAATTPCSVCEQGTYKNTEGTIACMRCPENTTSPNTTAGSTSSSSCVCAAGWQGPLRRVIYDFATCPSNTDSGTWQTCAANWGATFLFDCLMNNGIYRNTGAGYVQWVLPNNYRYLFVSFYNPWTGSMMMIIIIIRCL